MSPIPIDRDTVLLLDLSSYIFRAYHAIRALNNRNGLPTNAVYGVARMLIRLLKDHPDANVVAVLDAPGPSWRADVYPEYKANRPPAPEDLKVQIDYVYKLVKALGIPTIQRDGYEADDLIAALAKRQAARGRRVLLVSGDKDLMQLIDDGRIVMWDPMKDVWYDADAVEKKWGVRPEQIADLFALMGDSSDNVPGVPGIGAKRAAQLLQEHGSLRNLLAHRDELPAQKWADNLRERPDLAEISYRIVHLDDCFPDDSLDVDRLERTPPDRESLAHLLEELDFSSMRGDLDRIVAALTEAAASPAEVPPAPHEMRAEIIDGAGALADWLQRGRTIGVDTETTSLQPRVARIVGISLADRADHGAYLPLAHQFGDNVPLDEIREQLAELFAADDIPKVGQNLKYDIGVLRNAGFSLNGVAGDSMIASYLLSPDENSHSLDEIARREFGVTLIAFKEVAPDSNFAATPVDEAARYAAEDAAVALALCERLHPRLVEQGLDAVYREIELPLVPVLADMEWNGIRVDTDALEALQRELQTRIHHIEAEVTAEIGRGINLNSPAQIGELLFDELGLPTKGVRKTKTGKWSTKESVLEDLREAHPLVPRILEYRTLSKMLQTYAIGLRNAVLPETGRIHPSFQQTRAATGRLSCTDPNLQNIPVRDEWGRRLRAAFVAEPGHLFVGADYSQIELRILAHYSEDPGLIEAFRTGQDIHSRTAAELFDVP
ncbi:MAG: DNA polymerase I, partial [Candidatus Dadabacteria bacterium]